MRILQECKNAHKIGISGHIRPDGDCVGSCLALYQYLEKCMPNAEIKVFLEKPSDIFAGIRGFEQIDSCFPEEEVFDVFFALDTNEERLGEARKYFQGASKKINIDHHISNAAGCGDVNYIYPEAGSTSELIYDLILADDNMGVMDADLAQSIYIGMIHDTGVFQYSNTTPKALRIAAELISYGFHFTRLIEETFYQKTYAQTRILGHALRKSELYVDGQVIASCITAEEMAGFGVTTQDLDGIVNQLRNIKGVHCAVFAYELENGAYKVSMRSDEKAGVSQIAGLFGGGGHVRAAGFNMSGTYEECLKKLLPYLKEQLMR